ncbi:hypothetical protein EJB05_34140, partial [Eragrostis curvula]
MPPPELTDDLVGEFLLRIPLDDDPACLLRASLVCKRWRRILADPAFLRRRHRALHRTPSVLGFISNAKGSQPCRSRFVPIDPASRRPAARDFPYWLVLDCRHGRALFLVPSEGPVAGEDFVVWDSLTNEQYRLHRPLGGIPFNAAVYCSAAAEGCDHRDCHGGPFCVVLISSIWRSGECVTFARVYSSESGDWGEEMVVNHPQVCIDICPSPTTLVGDALYFHGDKGYAFEYQLGIQRLSVIDPPPRSMCKGSSIFHMSMEDGRLGFANVEKNPRLRLCLWSRETFSDGVEQWARGRAIELETLLPNCALPPPMLASGRRRYRKPIAKVADSIFVGTTTHDGAVYMAQLNSGRARKASDGCNYIFPYTSFCIPGM